MYSIIVADPPWAFGDKLQMSDVKRGAFSNYSTLSTRDLKSLPIKEITDPNGCVLALWVPSSLLTDGLEIMQAWGFTHKQVYVWVKNKKEPLSDILNAIKKLPIVQKDLSKQTIKDSIKEIKKECNIQLNNLLQFGMGRLFRQCHEIALIGVSNTKIYTKLQNRSQRSVCFAPNEKHSKKPENLQNALEIMFPNAKMLELFARRERSNWTCLGNEIGEKEDIRISLAKLIKTAQ